MRKRKGFTLAELLIVVAIIGVLVAVAIPVFTSSLEKAKRSVCLANQTSAQHILTYEKLLGTEDIADKWIAIVQDAMGDIGKLCPSHGTYNYNDENDIVSCTYHNATSVEIINRTPVKIMDLDMVQKFFYNGNGTRNHSNVQLDSTGPNFGVDARVQIQKALGLPSDDFDFRIYWQGYDPAPKIYVFNKIKLENVGEKRDVIGYRLKQNEKNQWEIEKTLEGSGEVIKTKVQDKTGKWVEYARINVENMKW